MSDLRDRPTARPHPTPHGGVEHPGSVGEAAELLADTTGSVLVRGGTTKIDWAGRVDGPDLVLDTTRLLGIISHNPADMTAAVRAGTTLADLQQHLAKDGQWLALDPPTAAVGATIGGLLAAGDSGPSRLRYGGLRDLVIGVTLVLADGTVARAGGHVIKNVAGYDLAKLVHGSLGSIAMVAEVVVRLHPRSAASVTTACAATATQATTAAEALAASPLEPTAVEWVSGPASTSGTGRLLVRSDGTHDYADRATGRVNDLLAGLGLVADALSAPDAEDAWKSQAAAVRGTQDETVLRICGLPSNLGRLAETADRLATEAGVALQMASSAALGMHTLRLGAAAADDLGEVVTSLQSEAARHGESVLLRQRPRGLDGVVDALGPAPSTVGLLRAIKAQFDPTGRLAPGRFQPWY